MEHDVWETDEVYGDYIIEVNEETTKISYNCKGHIINIQTYQITISLELSEELYVNIFQRIPFLSHRGIKNKKNELNEILVFKHLIHSRNQHHPQNC